MEIIWWDYFHPVHSVVFLGILWHPSLGRFGALTQVLFHSPFIPPEWIAAHGLRPWRVAGDEGPSDAVAPPTSVLGRCCWMRSVVASAQAMAADVCLILTTGCDQSRRSADLPELADGPPVFVFNLPATWERSSAFRLYQSEMRRLGRFLESQGGRAPTGPHLGAVARRFDRARLDLRAARPFCSARAFAEALLRLGRWAGDDPAPSAPVPAAAAQNPSPVGAPIALLGGPLTARQFALYDHIAALGGRVVLDGLEWGERALPRPLDARRLADDPFFEMTEAHFLSIAEVFQRPNSRLYQWFRDHPERAAAQGVVMWCPVWCDLWGGEFERFRQWAGLPALTLKAAEDGPPDAHLTTRLQAFLEMLR